MKSAYNEHIASTHIIVNKTTFIDDVGMISWIAAIERLTETQVLA